MSQILIKNLTFGYDGSYDNIFEDVSFQIDTDWKLGFTGRNGRGKTTFLNLLQGKYEYNGSITASVDFEYFPFHVTDPTINAIDVVENASPYYEYWELIRELNLLEVSEDILYHPFNTLSNGEQTKLLLAAMFIKENSFLLIDEPTNHLDINGREIVSRYLNSKKGFILVSHDRTFIDNCVDHILAINRNNIEIQQGNFSSWLMNKERSDRFELAENEKLRSEIKRLKTSAEEKSKWSDKTETAKYDTRDSGLRPDRGFVGHKAAKMMKRSKAIGKRQADVIEEKSKLLKNIEKSDSLKITQPIFHTNNLVTLSDISISYGEKVVCKNLSFSIETGDRIVLCGKNGCGKSSIIKLIWGEKTPFTGTVNKSSRLKISYVAQTASNLKGNLSDYAAENNIDESLFKAILRKLDFSREQFEKDMKDFSDGQKKKVLIVKSLCEKSHLLLWDEPLNYIDVISRIQIENLLTEFKPTILFVEHDGAFSEKIATKTIQIY